MVGPDLKVISQTGVFLTKVIEKDSGFTVITIPPLVECLNKQIWFILFAD